MTDDADSMDALLSADLDGETGLGERDSIEADPALRARRSELNQASELAGQPPDPLAPAVVDHAIDRAIASIQPARQEQPRRRAPSGRAAFRRPSSQPRAVPWLVAAAVVLLAGTGLGLIITDRSPVRHPEAATATTVPRNQDKSAGQAFRGQSSAKPSLPSLGTFASPAAFRSSLATKLPPARRPEGPASRTPSLTSSQADRCSTVLEARDPQLVRSNRRAVAAASIASEPVLVLEYRARAIGEDRETTRVIAVGPGACNERVDFQR